MYNLKKCKIFVIDCKFAALLFVTIVGKQPREAVTSGRSCETHYRRNIWVAGIIFRIPSTTIRLLTN